MTILAERPKREVPKEESFTSPEMIDGFLVELARLRLMFSEIRGLTAEVIAHMRSSETGYALPMQGADADSLAGELHFLRTVVMSIDNEPQRDSFLKRISEIANDPQAAQQAFVVWLLAHAPEITMISESITRQVATFGAAYIDGRKMKELCESIAEGFNASVRV